MKDELVLNKNFKIFLEEFCDVYNYDKRNAARVVNCLISYHYLDKDDTVFDFVSKHTRKDINRTICFHNMGDRGYTMLLNAINALNIPLKDEPGFKKFFNEYHKYMETNNPKEVKIKDEQYESLLFEFNSLKDQLADNRKLLTDLMIANRLLDDKLDSIRKKIDDLDAKKY